MGYIKEFDLQANGLVRRLPASWRPLMQGLSILGEPVIVVLAGLAGFLAASLRGQDASRRAFIYALLAYGIGIILKHMFKRARPNHLNIESFGLKSYSFPSGHAFGSVIFYGLFAIIDARHLLFPWNFLAAAVVWMIIFLIGLSRVYLKSHYPSDVVGGWLFGAAALVIIAHAAFN
jgi:undecaprenyl-diphosphatase